ncbi:MAG TPA: methyltransferase domain-containing protein [Bryobacteraceae bacterium]|nr:methyltransferase domain-containing protein [Bryobacteraceae bacterium]
MAEFTGERVIPGLVEPDLYNEHLARYRFAERFCEGAKVLDAGCGSGYGAAQLTNASSVVGTDVSAEAVEYATRNFAAARIAFAQARCESLPFGNKTFDVVTAFEVIEHLERWRDLLTEACRVLSDTGVLLISTPNKSYYAEMRSEAGPNPFHCHEFEFDEFQKALREVFPHVQLWTQNHVETIIFSGPESAAMTLETPGDPNPENAHFYFAACSRSAIDSKAPFVWMPTAGNVLRERERHIAKLDGELRRKDEWLDELNARHTALHEEHNAALAEVRERTEWAHELNRRIADRDSRIEALQTEIAERLEWIRGLEVDLANAWTEIRRLKGRETALESDLTARTLWGQSLDARIAELTQNLELEKAEIERYRERERMIANSRWVRFGRKLQLGPVVDPE